MNAFEPGKIVQQMMDFQKTALDNTYNTMCMIQGQAEKMTESFFSSNTLIPEDSKKMLQEWMLTIKKGQADFKKTMDENFKKFESFSSMSEPASKPEKASAKTASATSAS